MNILVGIGIYLGIGVFALELLDLCTGRIRNRLFTASKETRDKLAVSGSLVGSKEAMALTIGALCLFWPVAIFAALRGGKSGQEE